MRRSLAELAVTVLPLAAFWAAGLYLVGLGQWWAMLLTPLAAVFLVRLFMIQHDCGHGAFFASTAANTWTGRLIGVLTMTPYDYWRRTHAIHHATSSNLDRRGLGGVETMTVREYAAASRSRRLGYRLYRHPAVMFGLGAAYMFILQHRLPIGLMSDRRAWLSVMGANLGLALLLAGQIAWAGPAAALAVNAAIIVVAAAIGIWLFFVQHQFEGAWWARNDDWSAHASALQGSSHLDLPPVLRWFSANIGAHHIHHLSSKIPFYRLPNVLRDHPALRDVGRITLRDSFRMTRLALWDEAGGRLVSFRSATAAERGCA